MVLIAELQDAIGFALIAVIQQNSHGTKRSIDRFGLAILQGGIRMRTPTILAACFLLLLPVQVSAEEFPPKPPLQVSNGRDVRVLTNKRGLSMLPKAALPPVSADIGGGGGFSSASTANESDQIVGGSTHGRNTLVHHMKSGLEADARRAQAGFASLFSRTDPCPAARVDHFDWLPHYEGLSVEFIGWSAEVCSVVPDIAGAWTITVRMRPRLMSSFRCLVMDYVQESYRLKEGKILLIASDANEPKPRLQVYPAAP